VTREDLDHLVDVTRAVPDELEIVREPPHDEPFAVVDAREGGEDAPVDDAAPHPSPISPEMIGLPVASSDLLPRRRRFLLRTRPAVTEPHVEPHTESHAEPRVDAVASRPVPDPPEIDEAAPPSSTDRPDLAGFDLPGTRAPRPVPRPARVVHPEASGPQPVADDAPAIPARPDRRARRRSRHTRVVLASCVALALLVLTTVVSMLALAAR
jgi:hypothetical protein